MIDAPRVDADELLKIGKLCSEWFNSLDISGQKPVELFDVLYQKTTEYLHGGVSIDKARFTSGELNAAMKLQDERDDSSEVARRYVRENLKKYQTLIDERGDELDSLLKTAGVYQRIVISKTESKGRNKSYYYLDLEPMQQPEDEPVTLPPGAVHYRIRQLPNIPVLIRPLINSVLVGWRRGVFISIYIAAVILAYFLLMWMFIQPKIEFREILFFSGVFFLAWYIFRPFFKLLDLSIIQAPLFLMPWNTLYGQLEFFTTDQKHGDGRPMRYLRLVVYDSHCPICGAPINVIESGKEFHGRLIGACSESPNEHVYSFDHITKIGVPLRHNGYYGR
jgi:hypothetical protein